MKTYCSIELFDIYKKVIFYSIRLEDEELMETEKFYKRFLKSDEKITYAQEFEDLIGWLDIIGNEEGAIEYLFRFEDQASALPPKDRVIKRLRVVKIIGNRLRLYCIRLSESVVILLNGGVKMAQKNTDAGASDILPKFRLAQKVAKAITEKISDKYDDFEIKEKELVGDLTFFI